MKKKYFSINVSNGNSEHIGTVIAKTSEELNEKALEACQAHFDANVEIPTLNINDYLKGESGTIEIHVPDEFEIELFICETWVY